MPLSEEELRLLEQMERALAAEDPKFVSALQGRTLRTVARMRTLVAGLILLGGMALLIVGATTGGAAGTALGVVAFLVMLGSAMVGVAAWRGHRVPDERPASGADALFDFDDHPHRFEVIDGGRSSRAPKAKRQPRQPRQPRQRKQGTFMQRMEQRWQHRRDQGF